MSKLYLFQEQGVVELMKRKHNLLADDMGLGKTVQAIEMINRLNIRTVLCIVPASIKRNWQRKFNEWLTLKRAIQIIDKKTDFVTELSEIVIVNYDLISHSYMHQQLRTRQWDLIIMDEAHRLKNMDANRTQAVLAKNGLVHSATRSLAMTGTPVLNRPSELYPLLKVLAPLVIAPYRDYYSYAKRYCDAYQDSFSFNDKGASNIAELNQKLRQHYMIRRLTHEVEVQLPKKRYEMVFVDSTAGIKQKLTILDQASRTDFKHKNLGLGAGELATLRRETAEAKIEATIETIKTYVESAEKIGIFAYHHSVIERLIKELWVFGCVSITGGTGQNDREQAIRSFQENEKIKVFIGQIQAAGEGIDGLQDVCSNVLFLEWSWVPGEIEQACKRIHRIGQTKACLFRFLVWADSVEEHMMRVALDKVKVIKEILK